MSQTMVAISGNTFPVKDQLSRLGGRYNRDSRTWSVPVEVAAQAAKLVAEAPVQRYLNRSPRGRCAHCGERCSPGYRTCKECAHGGQSYYDRNGTFVLGSDD